MTAGSTVHFIRHLRLHNHHLIGVPFATPEAAVRGLGAVQAQDFEGAKWALSQRTGFLPNTVVDQAFAKGRILRTHLLRPTWHFVAPEDIRWMLKLTAPRVHAVNAYMYRKLELDDAVFSHAHATLVKALEGGKEVARPDVRTALESAGIVTRGELRFSYLLMHAELEGLICSGRKIGKQFSYALLEERVPPAPTLTREEALAELTRRYFTSHAPAMLKDFATWSGLTLTDAKIGIALLGKALIEETIDGRTYWYAPPDAISPMPPSPTVFLLPNYDEYGIGYKNHHALLDPRFVVTLRELYSHSLILDGQWAGMWRRTFDKGTAVVLLNPFATFTDAERAAVEAAARRFGDFLRLPVEVVGGS